jgi:hypothetical protein
MQNPKQYRIPKFQNIKIKDEIRTPTDEKIFCFENLIFEFIICFRISCFGFRIFLNPYKTMTSSYLKSYSVALTYIRTRSFNGNG